MASGLLVDSVTNYNFTTRAGYRACPQRLPDPICHRSQAEVNEWLSIGLNDIWLVAMGSCFGWSICRNPSAETLGTTTQALRDQNHHIIAKYSMSPSI